MMYECVRCKTVLAAGSTECPQCGMKFDRPIPDDATLSEQPLQQDEVIVPPPPVMEEEVVPPPSPAGYITPVPNPYPAPAPASYSPPPPMPVYVTPPSSSGLSSTNKILLIAVPLCLILLVGSFFIIQSLNQGNNTPAAPPQVATTTPSVAPPPPAAPGLAPLEASPGAGGGTSPSDANNPTQFLVGRWQSKSQNFYVFSGDGSGSRGAVSDSKNNENFTWALINNELDVHGSKDEKLAYSPGPDHNTMFLRQANGHYEQYSRVANS